MSSKKYTKSFKKSDNRLQLIKKLLPLLCIVLLNIRCETKTEPTPTVTEGVSHELSISRKHTLRNINYQLSFDLLDIEHTKGTLLLGFKIKSPEEDILLDFTGNCETLQINNSKSDILSSNGHLVLSKSLLKKGYNEIQIDFATAGVGLKKQEDYVYTLFVPNHASSVFPCFDQPNLKATYNLSLVVPSAWEVSSSTNSIDTSIDNNSKTVTFDQTEELSTYQFSFVAGVFQKTTQEVAGYQIEILHRENDVELVEANLDTILQEHARSLAWLENYTGIKQPFSKFGMALLPGFPFGGMEHVGTIQYNVRNLILSPSASLTEKMRRSNLIANETAHMWFGNLVTMSWFDDVWVKEVFANFIADKMLEELYPEVNHDLNFLFSHYPSAYEIDRTSGANAIHQELDNLNEASHMYGAIIYHKAPIMMRQLERYVDTRILEESLRTYLDSYRFGNATWQDLILILERTSGKDLSIFNDTWVNESGMPFIELKENTEHGLHEYDIIQHDPAGQDRIWPQYTSVNFSGESDDITKNIFLEKTHFIIPKLANTEPSNFILMNTSGMGYGVFAHGFAYDRDDFLFDHARVDLPEYSDDLMRGAAYVNLHEFVLSKGFHPELYFRFLNNYLKTETNELIIKYIISNITQVYFRFLNDDMRQRNAAYLESNLLTKLNESPNQSIKKVLFDAYIKLSLTKESLDHLKSFWNGDAIPEGITLSKMQKETLAINIAFKGSEEDEKYLDRQIQTMDDDDRIKRLKFITPALSHNDSIRNDFAEKLKDAANRTMEPWVLTAIAYLHHPYRNESAINQLQASLELLEELNQTNAISFIKRWLDNTFRGYQSYEALAIIDRYLEEYPTLNNHISMKVLQSRDLVERSQLNLDYYLGR